MKTLLAAMMMMMMMMLMAGGCMIGKTRPTTQPVTAVDAQLAEKEYWLNQPATWVVEGDFARLWEASEEAAREFLFKIDRRDQRSGLLTTQPMVSKQLFEFWRKDAGTIHDSAEASLQNVRRTIVFQFSREGDGVYIVAPKVVVEKESKVDQRYRIDSDLPDAYWYVLRRDEVMEKRVAKSIERKLIH